MRVGEALSWAQQRLSEAKVPEPKTDSEWLLAAALGVSRTALRLDTDREIEGEVWQKFSVWVKERSQRVPLAYILGTQPFFGLTLKVDRRVMVPRPETEQFVELVIHHLRAMSRSGVMVADIGTGCGAIALALVSFLPGASVVGVDISEGAIGVAEENARQLNLKKHVIFLHGNLTEPLEVIFPAGTFDAIIANLPYVSDDEWERLEPEVRCYEPEIALRGGRDGLVIIQALLERPLKKLLVSGGFLALEIGAGQGEAVQAILRRKGWKWIQIYRDLNGIGRFLIAWR